MQIFEKHHTCGQCALQRIKSYQNPETPPSSHGKKLALRFIRILYRLIIRVGSSRLHWNIAILRFKWVFGSFRRKTPFSDRPIIRIKSIIYQITSKYYITKHPNYIIFVLPIIFGKLYVNTWGFPIGLPLYLFGFSIINHPKCLSFLGQFLVCTLW